MSDIAQSLKDFADCTHDTWKCQQCGCRTNGLGVDAVSNGNLRLRVNDLEAENAKLRAAIDTMLLAFDYDGSRQVGAIFDAKENLKAVIRKDGGG